MQALKRSLLRAPSDVSSATTIIDRCFPTGAGDQVEPTTRVLRAVSFELVKEAALYALRHPTRLCDAFNLALLIARLLTLDP